MVLNVGCGKICSVLMVDPGISHGVSHHLHCDDDT